MELCRICLTQRRNLRSMFTTIGTPTNLSYSVMMTELAHIKIYEGDGYSDKICLLCRNKLQEAYDFKSLIERSDRKLRNNKDNFAKLKKIRFNNVSDIKIEINFKTEPDPVLQIETKKEDVKLNFQNDSDAVFYNNTTIKRCNVKGEQASDHNIQALTVEDFLSTIKEEVNLNDCDTYDNYDPSDDEYFPPNYHFGNIDITHKRKKFDGAKKSKHKSKKSTSNFKKVLIKPIVLEDIRLVPSKSLRPKVPHKKKIKRTKETICPYCGKITKGLNSHMLLHTGQRSYKCEECPKSFWTRKLLQKHVKIHSGIKDFKCNKCIAAFYDKAQLQSHMKSHLDIRTFVCNLCNKGFKRKGTLNRHILRHSSANKTVKCELCNMSFFEKDQLQHHMRVHTGERPYNCQLCSQPYSYKHDFNRHCLKKHGVFLKRRSVNVMNEEVLMKERGLMREVLLRAQGVIVEDNPLNPFDYEGPQAAMAYHMAVQAIGNRQVAIDL